MFFVIGARREGFSGIGGRERVEEFTLQGRQKSIVFGRHLRPSGLFFLSFSNLRSFGVRMLPLLSRYFLVLPCAHFAFLSDVLAKPCFSLFFPRLQVRTGPTSMNRCGEPPRELRTGHHGPAIHSGTALKLRDAYKPLVTTLVLWLSAMNRQLIARISP